MQIQADLSGIPVRRMAETARQAYVALRFWLVPMGCCGTRCRMPAPC
nr:hypothetical protein [Citrobacter sp. FDAARGOS_156]